MAVNRAVDFGSLNHLILTQTRDQETCLPTHETYSEPAWSTENRDKKDVKYWVPNIDEKITPEVGEARERYLDQG